MARKHSKETLAPKLALDAHEIESIQRVVQSKCESLRNVPPLGLGELADELGVLSSTILNWGNVGILKPEVGIKGKQRIVNQYTQREVEKALLAKELTGRGWAPQQVLGAIPFWELSRRERDQTVFRPSPELSLSGRAALLLRARLLAFIGQLTAGLERPVTNCSLLVHKLSVQTELSKSGWVKWEPKSREQFLALANKKNSVAGYASKGTGEMQIYQRDKGRLQEITHGHNFYAIQFSGPSSDSVFEVVSGFEASSEDGLFAQLKQDPDLDIASVLARHLDQLTLLASILVDILVDVEAQLANYRLPADSQLHALVNMVCLAKADKWNFCGFLVTANETMLKMAAASINYPQRLKEQLYSIVSRGDRAPSLPGWVFANQDSVIIENITLDDPRLPDNNPEGLRALALIPAVSDKNVEGVLLVGNRNKQNDTIRCFNENELKLLQVFARVIGEAQARERLAYFDAQFVSMPRDEALQQDEKELRTALAHLTAKIKEHATNQMGLDNSVILFAVRLDGYGRLYSFNKVAAEWFAHRIRQALHLYLSREKIDDWQCPLRSRVFILSGDQIVGLIGHTQQDVRQLRDDIGEKLAHESQLIAQHTDKVAIKAYVWSVHFTYRDLVQQFGLSGPTPDSDALDGLAQHLIARTRGALKIVHYVHQGDDYMRKRDYSRARTEYDMADSNDHNNPYILRHKSECLAEIGSYKEAIKYGELAVKHDPTYAGSYRRLADAYLGDGDFENALKNYREAINHAPNEPIYHLSLAQALILRAPQGDLEEVINILNDAMGLDSPNNKVKYLAYKGEAYMRYKQFEAAALWYDQALRFDADNEALKWQLQKARQEARVRAG